MHTLARPRRLTGRPFPHQQYYRVAARISLLRPIVHCGLAGRALKLIHAVTDAEETHQGIKPGNALCQESGIA
jgi:hypothetical protein